MSGIEAGIRYWKPPANSRWLNRAKRNESTPPFSGWTPYRAYPEPYAVALEAVATTGMAYRDAVEEQALRPYEIQDLADRWHAALDALAAAGSES